MDFEFIERVVKLVEKAEIGELELESEDGLRVVVKKNPPEQPAPPANQPVYYTSAPMPSPSQAPATPPASGGGEPSPPPEDDVELIKAPMVGTFYRAPAPDAPPYVEVRDVVQKDTVVCILEAMKVMNEIKSGVTGIITEMLVENGQPVEYGQALFKVKKQ